MKKSEKSKAKSLDIAGAVGYNYKKWLEGVISAEKREFSARYINRLSKRLVCLN